MNKRFHLVVGVIVASTLSGIHCAQQGQWASYCTSSLDCTGGRSCVNNQCSIGTGDGGGGGNGDGGNGGDGGCVNLQCNQVTCPGGGTTSITGTVYDPSGQVPIYNALVYVPNGPVSPFTPGVSCDRCDAITSGSPLVVGLSGSDGRFNIRNVPVVPDGGTIPLVIQVGRWRRQVTIPGVPACTSTPIINVNSTRLPRNRSEGDIPQMAIATGNADPFECLLLKMGISTSEFTSPGGGGRVHYYRQNGIDMSPSAPPASTLWSDGGTLRNYDVVLLPCEGAQNLKPALATQNIIDYTAAGGRVFTTHYGYVWVAYAQNPFPTTGDWRPDPQQLDNPPDPFTVTVDQSFPKGSAFAQWLRNVDAGTTLGSINLHETRHDLWAADGGS